MKRKILFPMVLAGIAMTVVAGNEATGAKAHLIAEISDRTAYCAASTELNNQLAGEGMTLLKNLDGYLPMMDATKISVFGKASTSLVYGGSGSGSGRVATGIKQIDLQTSLTNVGFELNSALTSFYQSSSKSGSGRTNGNTGWTGISQVTIGETPLKSYDDTLKGTFADYNDAAIMVIAREGSEGCDVKTCDCRDSKNDPFSHKHALELSNNEQDLFDMIKENFDNIIILINSGNIYQCDQFENDDQVKGVLWMGTPGATGASAVGKILKGEINPSGHTVDTWARDFREDPTFQNFGDNSQTNLVDDSKYVPNDTMFNADGSPVRADGTYKGEPQWDDEANYVVKSGLNGVRPSSYMNYEEGIYVDYRYYETCYREMAKVNADAADEWYAGKKGVIYPFGYGLSYTTFKQEIVGTTFAGRTLDNVKEEVKLKVKVTNTGDVAGKDVVQVYWKAPYEAGGIEKAYNALCAFDKTDILEPGESQVLELSFYIADVANYDFSDANNNGFMGYELDGGKYQVSINKNAHEEIENVEFKVTTEGLRFETDRYTNNKVENRFSGNDFYSSLPLESDVGFDQMKRDDMENTFPSHPTLEDRTLKADSRVEEFYTHEFTLADVDVPGVKNGEYVPEVVYKSKEDIQALGWSQEATTKSSSEYNIKEMAKYDLDSEEWDAVMDEFTWKELISFVHGGGTHNPAISRMGKPSTGDSDGPSCFKIMWWVGAPIVAATYNVELAKKQGEYVGIEGKIEGTPGWAGPACNIHRSPFGGRNFEYYSADPFLSGRICGRVVGGATENGVYCFFKHFAVNDQEKHREGLTVYLTEQALREIYLKPFQMGVQEGKSIGLMSSYNRLGLMETAASYPLLTEVLREEWGFKGSIISDMTHHSNDSFDNRYYENINNRILSGCNNQLDGSQYDEDMNATWSSAKGCPVFTYKGTEYESYSWWYAVREMAKGCIWMCAQCNKVIDKFVPRIDAEVTGAIDQVVTAHVGEEVDIELKLPEQYQEKAINGAEFVLDEITPLPAGLSLEDGHIVGVLEEDCNQFIRVYVDLDLGEAEPTRVGIVFEFFGTSNRVVNDYVAGGGAPKAGGLPAGAIVGIAGGAAVVIAAAIVVIILVNKKKKAA